MRAAKEGKKKKLAFAPPTQLNCQCPYSPCCVFAGRIRNHPLFHLPSTRWRQQETRDGTPIANCNTVWEETIVELAEIVVEGYAEVTLRSRDQRRPQKSSTQPVRCSCPCARSPKPSPMQRDDTYMTQHSEYGQVGAALPWSCTQPSSIPDRHLEACPSLE